MIKKIKEYEEKLQGKDEEIKDVLLKLKPLIKKDRSHLH